jgi:hypothetical protein
MRKINPQAIFHARKVFCVLLRSKLTHKLIYFIKSEKLSLIHSKTYLSIVLAITMRRMMRTRHKINAMKIQFHQLRYQFHVFLFFTAFLPSFILITMLLTILMTMLRIFFCAFLGNFPLSLHSSCRIMTTIIIKIIIIFSSSTSRGNFPSFIHFFSEYEEERRNEKGKKAICNHLMTSKHLQMVGKAILLNELG